jgi:SAM-dependent methyltransferase
MAISKDYLDHWTKPTDKKELHGLIAGSVAWNHAEEDAPKHADLILPKDASWTYKVPPGLGIPGTGENSCPMLEIGCGIGRIMKVFLDRGHIVSGSDISRPMLDEGRRYLAGIPEQQFKGFYLDDPKKPLHQLPSNHFGFVYSILVFQHLPTAQMIDDLIRATYRVLRPGGLVRAQTLVGSPKTGGDTFHPWVGSLFPSESAFAQAFSSNGFNIVEATRGDGYRDWLWVTARKPRAS